MEPSTVTIEIRRDTAVTLSWVAAGLLVVGGTFLATMNDHDHWEAVNATGIVAGLFLGAVLGYTLSPPVSTKARIAGFAVAVLVGATLTYGWASMHAQSEWQRRLLSDIRSTIGRGILYGEMPDSLLPVLAAHYRAPAPAGRSIGSTFRRLHPTMTVGSDLHQKSWHTDSTVILLQELSDSAVVLVGVDGVGKGWDPGFVAVNQRKGVIQVRFRLTNRGLEFWDEN